MTMLISVLWSINRLCEYKLEHDNYKYNKLLNDYEISYDNYFYESVSMILSLIVILFSYFFLDTHMHTTFYQSNIVLIIY